MADRGRITTAVIPAAGLGTRMAALAVDGCKELIEVGGISMLERTVFELEQAGLERIIAVSSPAKPALDAACAELNVEVVHQIEANGLVDAVLCAAVEGPVLVALPDVLMPDLNVSSALLQRHSGGTMLATVKASEPWCQMLTDTGRVLELEEDRILAFADKDKESPFPEGEIRIIGRYIWSAEFFEHAHLGELEALRQLEILHACPVKTAYIDVGNPVGYAYAQSIFNQ